MRSGELRARLAELLRAADLRAEALDPASTWAIFKAILAEPISDRGVEDDCASFQCGRRDWGDGTIGPAAYYTRQFSISDESEQKYVTPPGTPREWILGFAFGFQYPEHLETRLSEVMYWTSDFDALDEFITAVESDPVFRLVVTSRPERTELVIDGP